MKLIKISPQGQITIPRCYRSLAPAGIFQIHLEGKRLIISPVEISIPKTDDEIIEELLKKHYK